MYAAHRHGAYCQCSRCQWRQLLPKLAIRLFPYGFGTMSRDPPWFLHLIFKFSSQVLYTTSSFETFFGALSRSSRWIEMKILALLDYIFRNCIGLTAFKKKCEITCRLVEFHHLTLIGS